MTYATMKLSSMLLLAVMRVVRMLIESRLMSSESMERQPLSRSKSCAKKASTWVGSSPAMIKETFLDQLLNL